MCGLVGVICASGDEPDRPEMRRLASLLEHRGPDEEGLFIGRGIALAVRRLAIIDVAGGRQPLHGEDGNVVVVGNGEIFNAVGLRDELVVRGHRFATGSDLEVVVHGYEEWGEAVVARLRGMFALAIVDQAERRLLLTRDRFGMKPLYYARAGGRLAFGSEIRPLLSALPALTREADPLALAGVVAVGFVPGPRTAVAGVVSLPPGTTLDVVNGQHGEPRPYWVPPRTDLGGDGGGAADPAMAFRQHLDNAVTAWTTSDVPVAALLSGGVDSSSIVATMTALSGQAPTTFTVAFDGPPHDESEAARATAAALGSEHHEVVCTDRDFDRWPEVVRRLEAPQASATAIPLMLLYEACHDAGFKVIMTGEGADELLGGYHWFEGDRRVRRLLALPRPVRVALARSPLPMSPAARRVLTVGPQPHGSRYATWLGSSALSLGDDLLTAGPAQVGHDWDTRLEAELADRSPFDAFRVLESRSRLPDFVNHEVDRMSMAASVEARTPFLDHELWAWTVSQPMATDRNKALLRSAMRGRVPEPARTRPKWGLAAPHARWWRRERLPSWAEDALAPAALQETGYFRTDTVAHLRDRHRRGDADTSSLLAAVLTTQLFHQEVLTA